MQVKEMREILKDQVEIVPRSNDKVMELYSKLHGETPMETSAGEEWTYIGTGDTPPHMIKFMSIQNFVRGQPTKVTDPRVLAKICVNRSFVKGKADMDEVFKNDEIAAKRAEKQREKDLQLQIMVERQNRKG